MIRDFLVRRPWKRSFAWLCFLGPFFFVMYGFANHHTAALRFSFEKPEIVQPLFRWMFDALGAFDLPYNQAPSLHLCLLVLLWAAYKRHAPAKWKR